MKIKWLTKEEVREYATTPARALEISERHHQQIVDATEDEIKKHGTVGLIDGVLCGLCYYYCTSRNGGCDVCPLGKDGDSCGNRDSLWAQAGGTLVGLFNHKAFIKAETALLNRLKQLKSGDKSMKKEEELKIKLEQTEQHKTEVTAALDEKIESLQEQLAACAKPELDYSKTIIATGEDEIYVLVANCDTKSYKVQGYDWLRLSDGGFNSKCCWPTPQEAVACYNSARNIDLKEIFSDLARNAEPLEEFEVEWPGGYKFSAKLLDDNCGHKYCGALVKIDSGSSCYTFEKVTEIHQKLGQMLAWAKRKAAKT